MTGHVTAAVLGFIEGLGYRACEMVGQLRWLREHGQKTGNFDSSRLPEPHHTEYTRRKERLGGRNLQLGLRDAYELLGQLNDPVGQEFTRRYGCHPKWGDLHNRLETRNDSLLAHGVRPIQQEEAEALRDHVLALAEIVDPDIIQVWLPKAQPIRFRSF